MGFFLDLELPGHRGWPWKSGNGRRGKSGKSILDYPGTLPGMGNSWFSPFYPVLLDEALGLDPGDSSISHLSLIPNSVGSSSRIPPHPDPNSHLIPISMASTSQFLPHPKFHGILILISVGSSSQRTRTPKEASRGVWDLSGNSIQGVLRLDFWVMNFGVGIPGLGFWGWNCRTGILGLGFWGQEFGIGILGAGISGLGFWSWDFEVEILGKDFGAGIWRLEFWAQEFWG